MGNIVKTLQTVNTLNIVTIVKMENTTAQDMMIWVQTTEYEGPVGVTAKFFVKKDQVTQFCELMRSMVEEWETVSDLKSHCMTDIFQKSGERMGSLLRDP